MKISALYKDRTFVDSVILYGDYTIRIALTSTDSPMTTQSYYLFLTQLHSYLDVIDKELTGVE